MQVNLKTILNIGKIVCEVTVIALSIAALCTPAVGVVIAGVVVGAIAWGLSQAEDALENDTIEFSVHLGSGYDIASSVNQNDTDVLVSGDASTITNES